MEQLKEREKSNGVYRPEIYEPMTESKSDEVEEIMGQMPGWIIRRGVMVMFLIVLALLTGGYFIKYPDLITTKVMITYNNPPVRIVSGSSGRIQTLFVQDNEQVVRDQPIAVLDNPASVDDVRYVKNMLDQLDSMLTRTAAVGQLNLPGHLVLGELQSVYAGFYLSFREYQFFIQQNASMKLINHLKVQMHYFSAMNEELQRKEKLLNKQLELEHGKFAIDSLLLRDSVVTTLEFYNSQLNVVSQRINTDDIKFRVLENKIQASEYLKIIYEQEQLQQQQDNALRSRIFEEARGLEGALALWEQKYLLKTPLAGKVNFFKFWKENQYVQAAEALLMVIPDQQDYVCRATLPIAGAGKVKPGQRVLIKLDAYPYEEFGMISGEVERISPVALDDAYALEITLTQGLQTNRKKQIPPSSLLEGRAEVLTNHRSILQRVFDKVWHFDDYN